MESNGQLPNSTPEAHVLRWAGRVLAAEDLRLHLNGHHELILPPRVIITPLAAEEIRSRGIRVTHQALQTTAPDAGRGTWGYAQERPQPLVTSAVQALRRDGLTLQELPALTGYSTCGWARALAECVARGDCLGGVIFCQDPGLICCVANKVPGLRAVAVGSVSQAARATLNLGPNLVAIEVPGRTFFEMRQILRTLCIPGQSPCPDGVACTLKELDGHAHR